MTARMGDKQLQIPDCFINGFNTEPLNLQLPHRLMFFGIQLQPLAVKKILGIPSREFSDKIVDMTLIDPSFRFLWQQLADGENFNNRISVVNKWLEKKIPDWQPQEKMMNSFLSDMTAQDISVSELARSLCYSARQLSRKMDEATGMNTEAILLYKKYLHAVNLIHHSDLSLTNIAYQSYFSDQSHFIRSFKTYTGMTPGEYKTGKSLLKGHLYENVR